MGILDLFVRSMRPETQFLLPMYAAARAKSRTQGGIEHQNAILPNERDDLSLHLLLAPQSIQS
jgi:hypothetical protein